MLIATVFLLLLPLLLPLLFPLLLLPCIQRSNCLTKSQLTTTIRYHYQFEDKQTSVFDNYQFVRKRIISGSFVQPGCPVPVIFVCEWLQVEAFRSLVLEVMTVCMTVSHFVHELTTCNNL